jgi:hypothetical protein
MTADGDLSVTGPAGDEARLVALRLITASEATGETYAEEVRLALQNLLAIPDELERTTRIVLLLDALRTYAAVAIGMFRMEHGLSSGQTIDALEKAVDEVLRRKHSGD